MTALRPMALASVLVLGCESVDGGLGSTKEEGALQGTAVGGDLRWPAVGYLAARYSESAYCTATLLAPRVAVTSLACVRAHDVGQGYFGLGWPKDALRDGASLRVPVAHVVEEASAVDDDDARLAYVLLRETALTPERMGVRYARASSSRSTSRRCDLTVVGYGNRDVDGYGYAPSRRLSTSVCDEGRLEGETSERIDVQSVHGTLCHVDGDFGAALLRTTDDDRPTLVGLFVGEVVYAGAPCTETRATYVDAAAHFPFIEEALAAGARY